MSTLPAWTSEALSMKVGSIYEHYKKKKYKIVAIARHSKSLEELVIYQTLEGEGGIWARPLSMFIEKIRIDGIEQPRFRLAPIKN